MDSLQLPQHGNSPKYIRRKNNIIDPNNAILYCKKEVIGNNYIKRKCGWTGVLSDIVTHIKSHHKENYFNGDNGKLMFKWQLPSYGDREDFGVIRNDMNFLLYSLYYSEKMKELTITIWNMSPTKNNLYYQTTLCHHHHEKAYTGTINNIQSINNEGYVPSSIVLQTDDIEHYCDEYKTFKFSLRIF
nr:uncharacterized protein LOC111424687 isoform X2 [Onthophagus taurus]